MEFRPCIDIHNGRVKQIVGSSLRDEGEPVTNFIADQPPSYYAELYRRDNLKGGHVIMLGKGNEEAAIKALHAFRGGLQIGGGITPENAKRFLNEGASHVIVTSWIFTDDIIDFEKVKIISNTVGAKQLVIDLSCKKINDKYFVVTNRWQTVTDTYLSQELFERLASYCDEFLIHASHVEGMQKGIDIDLVKLLSDTYVKPVTYAGGVNSFEDLENIALFGKEKINVTIGSALSIFGGALDYRQVVEWFRKHKFSNGKSDY
ncbi:MAG: phosphoribosylformimino-5-aminoimidazole carboxamide ribotide isomerase [Chitinispirillaceae bacterium]|nr:phosphoribosylformimino-5-aminoimidazole carboxamide ribotide isomerase [Chitinispirillaceae bacterium]